MKKISQYLLITIIIISAQLSFAITCPQGSEAKKRDTATGSIEECLSTATGKVEGPRNEYNQKGALVRSWNFKDGVPDGEFKVYDDKKQLTREGRFVNGRLEGKMRRWYQKGRLQDETNWLDGRPHGPAKRYFKNGKVMESGNYQVGRRVGIWKFNKENGSSLPDRNYGEDFKGDIALQSFGASVKADKETNNDLTWEQYVDVEKKTNKERSFLNARVEAVTKETGWTLEYAGQTFQPWDLEQRKLTIDVPLEGKETKAQVIAIGPQDKKITYNLTVTSQSPDYKEEIAVKEKSDKYEITALLGVQQHDYKEGSSVSSSYLNLSVGAAFKYKFDSPHIEALASASYEAVTLSKSSGDKALTFLNADVLLGYLTGEQNTVLRFGLFGGPFYRTTNGETYGLKNLMGPKISPHLRFKMTDAQTIHAFLHVAPVFGEGMGVNPSSQVETTLEVGWTKKLESGNNISVLFNSTTLKIEDVNTLLESKSNGVSVGYGF